MICGYLYTIKLFNIKITIFKYHIIFVEIFTYLYNILISYNYGPFKRTTSITCRFNLSIIL